MSEIELQRHVRVEVVRDARREGLSIEFWNRRVAIRHAVLRVEVLDAAEHGALVAPTEQRKEPAAFEVIPLKLPRDVRRNTGEQREGIVEAAGIADEHARELSTRFIPAPAIPGIEFDDADGRIEPRNIEAAVPAPAA